ncbi:uroporphyrinogen-III synthase [Dongia sp.]|uniref:uroporphyrinogen-III synthase n=1 Tax=Dongia sp. TaxID=1977262 RepID=UPI0035B2F27C
MHILITRPRDDAAALAATLAARGIETTLEPLLTIQPVGAPVIDLDNVQAILFTSANGVRCFAAANPHRDIKVFAVGDNSAAQARELGFTSVESAAGDVDSLAGLVIDKLHPRDGALLHAAGANLAGDLRGQLQAAGFVVNRVVLYDAVPVTELSPANVMNLRLGGIDAVALFSPRTGRIFAELWRQAQNGNEAGLGAVTALCLSAAVAAEIKDLGWQRIVTAENPDREGMLALIDREMKRGNAAMVGSDQDKATLAGEGETAQSNDAADAARGAAIIAAMPAPRSSRAGGLVLGLIAGALAGGAVTIAEPYWRPYLPLQQTDTGTDPALATQIATGITAEIAALKEQIAALQSEQDVDAEARSRIDTLQSEIANWKSELETATGQSSAGQTAAIDLGPLEGRLEALEGRVASLSEALAAQPAPEDVPEPAAPAVDAARFDDLNSRFTALEEKLAALDSLSAETATQKAEIETANARLANLDLLDSRLKSLEENAATLGSDLETLAKEQGDAALKQQRAAALVLSIGQLRGVLGTDKAYDSALAALEDLARPDAEMTARLAPILDPLRERAASGVPTLSQLQASFPATGIAQAATADAAGAAIGVETGWLQQTLNRLSELITVRPVGDVAGDGALAILARAENKLAAGDLAGAVAETGGLTGQAADAVAAWQKEAQARLALDAAAAQLAALSAEALVPAADPTQSN